MKERRNWKNAIKRKRQIVTLLLMSVVFSLSAQNADAEREYVACGGNKSHCCKYAGGFGCVYEAGHTFLGTCCSIKEFFVKDRCNRSRDGSVTVAILN